MLPLYDDNPCRTTPIVTIALIVLNVVVFLYQLLIGLDASVFLYGLVPAALTQGQSLVPVHTSQGMVGIQNLQPAWATLFTSMFMHGGFMHIIGNMWYLWIFGNNVEDVMGKPRFILFYLASGIGAAALQVVLGPGSQIPMVGASGAIAGVLGAYLVLFPGSRVRSIVTLGFFWTTADIPALIVLGFWFVLQFFGGLGALGMHQAGGTAYGAHVGGFILGLLLGRVLASPEPAVARREHRPPDYTDWR
jgi:membrane associated rhomboid family serine protease